MTMRVINIKSKEHFDIYIGNRVRFHPEKYPYAPLLRKYGINRVVVMHREHVLANPE